MFKFIYNCILTYCYVKLLKTWVVSHESVFIVHIIKHDDINFSVVIQFHMELLAKIRAIHSYVAKVYPELAGFS